MCGICRDDEHAPSLVRGPDGSRGRASGLADSTLAAEKTIEGVGAPFLIDVRDRKSTRELQSLTNVVCRLLLEKKKNLRAAVQLQRRSQPCIAPHKHAMLDDLSMTDVGCRRDERRRRNDGNQAVEPAMRREPVA